MTQADLLSQETDAEKLQRWVSMAHHKQNADPYLRAGTSWVSILKCPLRCTFSYIHRTVSVKRTSDTPGNVNIERWANGLAHAMTIFFDCQFYTTKFDFRVDWCFYGDILPEYHQTIIVWLYVGLAEQTVAAAHAFEMVRCFIYSISSGLKDSTDI